MIDPSCCLAVTTTVEVDTGAAWVMLFIYLGLALGFSFLCSLLEASLLSVPQPHVALLAQKQLRSGLLLMGMKENIDRPLAAILTLNTIAHTVGAAGVGAEVQIIFGVTWVTVASAIVTLLILVLSEIIPKSLGAVHAKALSRFTAYTVHWLILITYPLVIALEAISRRIGGDGPPRMTREEVRIVADLGETAGAIDEQESRIIRNIVRLRDVRVRDVMTPRPVVFMLPAEATVETVVEEHRPIPFSRMLLFQGSRDHIVGLVHRHTVLRALQEGRTSATMQQIAQPVHAVPDAAPVANTLREFIARQEHLFQVVDEFGGTAGIITMEDALETLLGVEILDETDTVEDMRDFARKRSQRRYRQLVPQESDPTTPHPETDAPQPDNET